MRACACGCGAPVPDRPARRKYAGGACRLRAHKRRRAEPAPPLPGYSRNCACGCGTPIPDHPTHRRYACAGCRVRAFKGRKSDPTDTLRKAVRRYFATEGTPEEAEARAAMRRLAGLDDPVADPPDAERSRMKI